jgi:hypothetical protein
MGLQPLPFIKPTEREQKRIYARVAKRNRRQEKKLAVPIKRKT